MVLQNRSAAEAFDALRVISQHTDVTLHDVTAIMNACRTVPPLFSSGAPPAPGCRRR